MEGRIMCKLGLVAVALLAVAGCGSGGSRANVEVGSMPQNGSFTGVYFSPQYGEMQMVQNGSTVIGEYTKDERRGRIQGTVNGNVLRFEWSERRELIQGRPTVNRGRGYFRYLVDNNGDHVIVGEWGHDDDETGGGPWRAAKSRTRQPQLSTDTTGGDDGSGEPTSDWDREDSGDTAPPPDDSGDSGGDSGGDDDLDDLQL